MKLNGFGVFAGMGFLSAMTTEPCLSQPLPQQPVILTHVWYKTFCEPEALCQVAIAVPVVGPATGEVGELLSCVLLFTYQLKFY